MSVAATMALTMASSVDSTVARNTGSRESLGSILTSLAAGPAAPAPEFAVEKAMNMSPDPLPEIRERESHARVSRESH